MILQTLIQQLLEFILLLFIPIVLLSYVIIGEKTTTEIIDNFMKVFVLLMKLVFILFLAIGLTICTVIVKLFFLK